MTYGEEDLDAAMLTPEQSAALFEGKARTFASVRRDAIRECLALVEAVVFARVAADRIRSLLDDTEHTR